MLGILRDLAGAVRELADSVVILGNMVLHLGKRLDRLETDTDLARIRADIVGPGGPMPPLDTDRQSPPG